ncbi:MAG: hypothetical protein ABIH11_07430 [Candidatus Altiarchaeota archaeon]
MDRPLPSDMIKPRPGGGGNWWVILVFIVSLMLFIGAAVLFFSSGDDEPNLGQAVTTVSDTTLKPVSDSKPGRGDYKRFDFGRFRYNMSFSDYGYGETSIQMTSVKYGGDYKNIVTYKSYGTGTTYASYVIGGNTFICVEEQGYDIRCYADSSMASNQEFYGLMGEIPYAMSGDLTDAGHLEGGHSTFTGKDRVAGRSCSLFEVDVVPGSNRSILSRLSYGTLYRYSEGNVSALICLDDEYGFTSMIALKTKTYSQLAGESVEVPFFSITLTDFSQAITPNDVMPPLGIDFIVNRVRCMKGMVSANISFIREKPAALTFNVTRYEYGRYDDGTGGYVPGGYKTVGLGLVEVPTHEADSYIMEYNASGLSSSDEVAICSKKRCESNVCYSSYGYPTSTVSTATGFAKIKPQLAGTWMNYDGGFISIFTNGVGTTIHVINASIKSSSVECVLSHTLDGILAGDNFQFVGKECIDDEEDPYNAIVSITYTVTIGGITTTHTETGTLRGPLEDTYEGECVGPFTLYGGVCRLESDFEHPQKTGEEAVTVTTTTLSSHIWSVDLPEGETLCSRIDGLERNECYNQLAEETMDPELCEQIDSAYVRESCKSAIKAIDEGDMKGCEYLSGKHTTGWCQTDVAVALQDPGLCHEITESDYTKYYCIVDVAVKQGRVETCLLIPEGAYPSQQDCEDRVREQLEGIGLCFNTTGDLDGVSTRTEQCYTGIILDALDAGVCTTIDGDDRDWCLRAAAILTNDQLICQTINDDHIRNRCYRQVAINLKSERICDKMDAEYGVESPESCKERLRRGGVAFCRPTDNDFVECLKKMLDSDEGGGEEQ